MRISTLCLSLLLASTIGKAQVTITQNEMPHAGDQLFRTQAMLNPLLNYSNTGPNSTWNYTNLVANGQGSQSYQTVGSTNIVYSVVYADLFFNGNRANHVTDGVDIPFYELLPIEDPYTFYFRSSSVYRKVGYGAEVAGIPIPITMSQQDVIYQLPLNFGNTSTSNSSYNLNVPTLAYYGYSQQRVNVVDGWGTVNTPAGTFNALRVKTTIAGRDTIQVDQLSLGFAIGRPLITEYKWLSPGRRLPVLQINTATVFGTELITGIFFFDEERTIAVNAPLANAYCPGQQLQVNYTRTGVFNPGGFLMAGNVFRAQLSDAAGSFTTPVNIGSVTSTQSGVINATIPANTPPGAGYRIRVIATNPGFTGASNSFNITIGTAPQAIASAAGPTQFCAGASVVLNAATQAANSYQWQLDGIALPGATLSSLEATTSGTYRVVVSTSCGSATSSPVAVVVDPLPEHQLEAPAEPSICDGAIATFSAIDLTGQGGLSYQWLLDGQALTGETSSVLNTSQAGAYSAQVTNPNTGCIFVTSTAGLGVETVVAPTVSATGLTTVCTGEEVVLEADAPLGTSVQWFLDGAVIAGAEGASLAANDAGVYTATATSSNACISASSNAIEVALDPLPTEPTLTALGATTFCFGEAVTLQASGDVDVTWQWFIDGSVIPSVGSSELTVSEGGTYTISATNAFGCSATASTAVTIEVVPEPDAPGLSAIGATTFCQGGTVSLEASDAGGAAYQWYVDGAPVAGAELSSYTASAAGVYTVELLNTFGCVSPVSNAVSVSVDPLPTQPVLTALGATVFCAGEEVTLQATGDTDVQWQWSLDGEPLIGANSNELVVSASGLYGVQATNSFGCAQAASQSLAVQVESIPPVPSVQAADAVVFCDGNGVTLIAEGANGATYQWTVDGQAIGGATQDQYLATQGGSYAAFTVSAAGCASVPSTVIDVTVNGLPSTPVVMADGPTEFCEVQSISLGAMGDMGSAFQWYLNGNVILGAGGSGFTAEESGAYTAIASDANGCSSAPSNAITISVEALPATPAITALDPTVFCAGGAAVLLATGDAGTTPQWSLNGSPIAGANAGSWVASTSGAYSVISTSATGCSSAAALATEVTVLPLPAQPTLSASGPTSFCTGGSVDLQTTVDAGLQIQWTVNGDAIPGATTETLNVSNSGSFAVNVTDGNGCTASSTIATVVANPLPEALSLSASGSSSICAGGSVDLQAGIAPGIGYSWYLDGVLLDGVTSQSYTAAMAGVYTVVAVSPQGCDAPVSSGITVSVSSLPNAPLITLTESPVFCEGSSTTLVASADAGVSYQWTLNGAPIGGATSSQYTASSAGSYSLVVTNANGCSATAVVGVLISVNALPNAPVVSLDFNILSATGPGAYQWSFNGTPIPGATGAELVVTSNGMYTVTTTNANGCSATSDPFTVSTVGMEESLGVRFSVFPNPNRGEFMIQLEALPNADTHYTLHDATGRLVQQERLTGVSNAVVVSQARVGMYFLQVVQNGVSRTQRVVIGH